MTLEEAKKLVPGQIVYDNTAINADGTPRRWRVNGIPKVWKTRPDEVKVPIKYGLYAYHYIREYSVGDFCLDEQEAADIFANRVSGN